MTDIMGEYPLTRALLVRLGGLDETDAQLPLSVLVNLHRVQLRAPLVAVGDLVMSTPNDWEAELTARYPTVNPNVLFKGNNDLSGLVLDWYRSGHRQALPLLDEAQVGLGRAIWYAEQVWTCYYPALFMHALSWDGFSAKGLVILEYLLGLHPDILPMLVDLAPRTSVVDAGDGHNG